MDENVENAPVNEEPVRVPQVVASYVGTVVVRGVGVEWKATNVDIEALIERTIESVYRAERLTVNVNLTRTDK